jgi:solute carrier family 25 phosphate transporter 23/24/25/41
MAVFEVLKRRHKKRTGNGHVGFGFVLTFGCISGSIAATLVYPLQLIRVRMQVQGTASHPATYKGIRDCFVQTYKGEGWRAFYRGLGTSLSKVAPATGLAFLSYEWSKALLDVG